MKIRWLEVLVLGAAGFAGCAPARTDVAVPGGRPWALAVGDTNGDGKAEILVGHALSPDAAGDVVGATELTTQTGDTFRSDLVALTDFEPDHLLLVDLNGDGVLDLVASRAFLEGGGNVRVLMGRGDGTFYAASELEDVGTPIGVAAGDVDGDGSVDIVVSSAAPGAPLQLHAGRGDGTFARPRAYYDVDPSRHLAVGDVNGDGRLEVVMGTADGSVDVVLNGGKGALLAPVRVGVGEGDVSIALADVDGDGQLEIVAAGDRTASMSVIKGLGPSFANQTFPLPAPANDLAVGDVNGDGLPEVLTVATKTSSVAVMQRTPDGRYVHAMTVPVGAGPVSIAVGDLHGTGKLDAITASSQEGTVSILHFPQAPRLRVPAPPAAKR